MLNAVSCQLVLCFTLLGFSLHVTAAEKADQIIIKKSANIMVLQKEGKSLHSYKIALGSNPVGRKEKDGDGKTPEGVYTITSKNLDSSYHIELGISYPNEGDKKRAELAGVKPGGDISIHGQKTGLGGAASVLQHFNWTNGSIAVSNAEIEEIAELVDTQTQVMILP